MNIFVITQYFFDRKFKESQTEEKIFKDQDSQTEEIRLEMPQIDSLVKEITSTIITSTPIKSRNKTPRTTLQTASPKIVASVLQLKFLDSQAISSTPIKSRNESPQTTPRMVSPKIVTQMKSSNDSNSSAITSTPIKSQNESPKTTSRITSPKIVPSSGQSSGLDLKSSDSMRLELFSQTSVVLQSQYSELSLTDISEKTEEIIPLAPTTPKLLNVSYEKNKSKPSNLSEIKVPQDLEAFSSSTDLKETSEENDEVGEELEEIKISDAASVIEESSQVNSDSSEKHNLTKAIDVKPGKSSKSSTEKNLETKLHEPGIVRTHTI